MMRWLHALQEQRDWQHQRRTVGDVASAMETTRGGDTGDEAMRTFAPSAAHATTAATALAAPSNAATGAADGHALCSVEPMGPAERASVHVVYNVVVGNVDIDDDSSVDSDSDHGDHAHVTVTNDGSHEHGASASGTAALPAADPLPLADSTGPSDTATSAQNEHTSAGSRELLKSPSEAALPLATASPAIKDSESQRRPMQSVGLSGATAAGLLSTLNATARDCDGASSTTAQQPIHPGSAPSGAPTATGLLRSVAGDPYAATAPASAPPAASSATRLIAEGNFRASVQRDGRDSAHGAGIVDGGAADPPLSPDSRRPPDRAASAAETASDAATVLPSTARHSTGRFKLSMRNWYNRTIVQPAHAIGHALGGSGPRTSSDAHRARDVSSVTQADIQVRDELIETLNARLRDLEVDRVARAAYDSIGEEARAARFAAQEQLIARLQEENVALSNEHDRLVAQLSAERAALQGELDKARNDTAAYQQLLHAKDSTIVDLSTRLERLRELDSVRAKLEMETCRADMIAQQNAFLNQELVAMHEEQEKDQDKLRRQVASLQQSLSEMQQELGKVRAAYMKLLQRIMGIQESDMHAAAPASGSAEMDQIKALLREAALANKYLLSQSGRTWRHRVWRAPVRWMWRKLTPARLSFRIRHRVWPPRTAFAGLCGHCLNPARIVALHADSTPGHDAYGFPLFSGAGDDAMAATAAAPVAGAAGAPDVRATEAAVAAKSGVTLGGLPAAAAAAARNNPIGAMLRPFYRVRYVAAADKSQDAWRQRWQAYMVAHHDLREFAKTEELKLLIRGGIPADLRNAVWGGCVRCLMQGEYEKAGASYYANLLKDHASAPSKATKQIELDLMRTMPNNMHYCRPDSDGITKLRRVLSAYSWRNPDIGYCQGMNMLAAIALLFLEEEDAFWCLAAIIEKIMPPDYYNQLMTASQADQRVLGDLLAEKLPRLRAHFDANAVDVSLITFNWFLTIFAECVPPEVRAAATHGGGGDGAAVRVETAACGPAQVGRPPGAYPYRVHGGEWPDHPAHMGHVPV